MSVDAVSGSYNAASLQKQYLADLKTLAADQAKQANQQILALDQAKVVQDATALAALTARQAQAQALAQTQNKTTSAAAAVAANTSTTASNNRTASNTIVSGTRSSTKVDLYL